MSSEKDDNGPGLDRAPGQWSNSPFSIRPFFKVLHLSISKSNLFEHFIVIYCS